MRTLIDTNVLIDYINQREPYYSDALKIVDACDKSLFDGCIAAHSVPDIYYILRKSHTPAERREALRIICKIFEVESLDKGKLLDALANESFTDFEDCLQSLCAADFHADYIVTRNPKDFAQSAIPTLTPGEFSSRFLDPLFRELADE